MNPTAEVAAAMLADFGAPVVCVLPSGTRRTTGHLRTATVPVPDGYGGQVQERRTTLSVPTGALGALPQDTVVTHAGQRYRVRSQGQSDDGALDVFDVVVAS